MTLHYYNYRFFTKEEATRAFPDLSRFKLYYSDEISKSFYKENKQDIFSVEMNNDLIKIHEEYFGNKCFLCNEDFTFNNKGIITPIYSLNKNGLAINGNTLLAHESCKWKNTHPLQQIENLIQNEKDLNKKNHLKRVEYIFEKVLKPVFLNNLQTYLGNEKNAQEVLNYILEGNKFDFDFLNNIYRNRKSILDTSNNFFKEVPHLFNATTYNIFKEQLSLNTSYETASNTIKDIDKVLKSEPNKLKQIKELYKLKNQKNEDGSNKYQNQKIYKALEYISLNDF